MSKTPGGTLVAPTNQRARTSRDAGAPPEDASPNTVGFSSWKDKILLLDVTQGNLAQATRYPLLGWPDFAQLLGGDGGVRHSHKIFETAPYSHMPFEQSPKREAVADPLSVTLTEAGAVPADQKNFCVLDARGKPEFLLENSHYQVYQSPKRRARTHPNAHN